MDHIAHDAKRSSSLITSLYSGISLKHETLGELVFGVAVFPNKDI